ncbi:MAG: hypothetical protein WBB01_16205 [Phormidesmis sp.]
MSLGFVLVGAQVARAQQSITGNVLGLEVDGDSCNIALIDAAGQFLTGVTDAAICEQTLVGSEIQFTVEIAQVEVIPPPAVATVSRLVAGDRACYVDLVDANGKPTTQFANFEICEQDIVGAEVQLAYATENVLAFSCQGDIDCGRTDTATLITQAEVISRPSAPAQPAIGSLPDGNYRYWSGSSSDTTVSDQELLASGGVTFLFSKRGNDITGIFGYVDGEAICVQGQVADMTVTGISVQNLRGARILSSGESFASFGSSDRLKVRRGQPIDADTVRYSSTLLNLEGLNRINAGSVLPPESC